MAITHNPLIGRSKNQVGNMVLSRSYNNNIMKAMPFLCNNPNSIEQQRQRTWFTYCRNWVTSLLPWTSYCFNSALKHQSYYHNLMQSFLNSNSTLIGPKAFDSNLLRFGKGSTKYTLFTNAVAVFVPDYEFRINFVPVINLPPALMNAQVHAVVFNITQSNFSYAATNIRYRSGYAVGYFPWEAQIGDKVIFLCGLVDAITGMLYTDFSSGEHLTGIII